jgi:hypothetical protein
MAFTVREKPPLRLSALLTDPSGRTTRWGADEPSAENVPNGLSFSTTMPGGFESANCSLPRKPGVAYADLTPFANWRIQGAGGECAWEGQLRDTPRSSGNDRAVTPRGAGYQAHLDDDKSARMIYVDQDLNGWHEASVQRRINVIGSGANPHAPSVAQDETTGEPSLELAMEEPWSASAFPQPEGWYDAKGIAIGSLYYAWKKTSNLGAADASLGYVANLSDDDILTSHDETANLRAAGPGTGTLSATTGTRTFVRVRLNYTAAVSSTANRRYAVYWTKLAVYGDHGLTKRGDASATEAQGLYASDVIAHALRTWAPLITFTEGSTGTLTPTSFVIPQLEFRDPTTVSQIISGANRFHLRDWAIWEGQRAGQPTFYYHDRGARGKAWRARIRPAELEETGQSADRVWNGILVRFNDVSGESRTVGPTGSGANTEDTALEDSDPLNPANQKGIRRWDVLDMGGVSTPAGAIEVGRRFLEEANQLDTSGQARLVGYVEDDRGVIHPAWKVRAGDTIAFTDASDRSARRIVKTNYDAATCTCSVDLDAPPEGLDALLERLQATLIPLGL